MGDRLRPGEERLLGHVDDRALGGVLDVGIPGCLGAVRPDEDVLDVVGLGDPGARHPIRARRGIRDAGRAGPGRAAIVLDRRTGRQVGVEQDLQVRAQRRQFRPQRGHLVIGLGTCLVREFATQVGLDVEFVLAARGDLPVQLEVVDGLEIAGLGLIQIGLPAIRHRHERTDHGGPQCQQDGQPQQFDQLVNTSAVLAPMASTSNTVSSPQPGRACRWPPRRARSPRDCSLMG